MAGLGEGSSDEEIFFGKMTLKEVKKQIWLNHGHKRSSISQQPTTPKSDRNSFKIIETHSQPNLRCASSNSPSPPGSARDSRKSYENCIKMENLVSNLCLSPEKEASLELNNTLEIVDYILKNGPQQAPIQIDAHIKTEKDIKLDITKKINSPNQFPDRVDTCIETEKDMTCIETEKDMTCIKTEKDMTCIKTEKDMTCIKTEKDMTIDIIETKTVKNEEIDPLHMKTEIATENECSKNHLPKMSPKKELPLSKILTPKTKIKPAVKTSPNYYTPMKSPQKQADVFSTPSSNMLRPKTPFTLSSKKPSAASLRCTPSKSSVYKHIKSPIATYIKGSIEVPMVTNVCPKKPLPSGSLIPKLVKNEAQSTKNKENFILPTAAYKSAKKTKVVHAPDDDKPKSQVAKKLLSTLPRPPLILKHETRQFNYEKKPPLRLPEDSIADLSCLQADLSVCTQVKPTKEK